nr:hypothetical protein [Tanacetum cinerariifolium]
MTLFNGIYDNCIYGAGMPIICTACGGIVRGGLCLPWDLREKNLYNYDPNAYSFNNLNYFPQPQDENYLCNLCGNNSHDDYDCKQQFLFVYEQEPSYNQNYDDNYYPHESLSFPCCDYCGGFHETFQCQPDNQNNEFSGSDQIQTPHHPDVNPPSLEINRPIFLNVNHPVQNNESPENSSEETVVLKTNQEPPQDSDIHQLIEECSVEVPKQVIHKSSISFKNTSQISSIHSIAPIQSTKEPEHLLSMEYEHFSITPETEYDEVTESDAENPLPIPSKCEVTLEDEIECDMPAKDESSSIFMTFSNPLFDYNDDFSSSDEESLPDEDVPAEEFKIYSNPLFDEDEINYDKLDLHYFNVESDFVESLLNRDTFIDFSSKFDFSELNAEITDTIIESIPLLPIPVQDGNSQQEEIDIVTETDDVLPPSVENDDDSSDDSLLEEADLFLVSDNLIPPSDSNFEDNPLISQPPPKPPNDKLDLEPDSGKDILAVVNKDVFDDENDDYCSFMFVIQFFLPYFIFPEISPLLLFAESEDTIFDPGISD